MLTIAADPRHLGARIGITAVLHTWGSALTHHPHVHMIVPGGGISLDGTRWVSSRPAFLLPVHVLGKLFRRLFLTGLTALHAAGRLQLLRRQGRAERPAGVRTRTSAIEDEELDRVCQAALRWPRGGAGLPVPLHAPRRHLQPPADLPYRCLAAATVENSAHPHWSRQRSTCQSRSPSRAAHTDRLEPPTLSPCETPIAPSPTAPARATIVVANTAQSSKPHRTLPWTARSFFGDFRTPDGVRNSSRKPTGCFEQVAAELDLAAGA